MKTIQAIFLCFFAMQMAATEQNPIFNAISQNDAQLVQNMLQSDEYSNVINQEGQTILHAAVLANNWKAVKAILKSGFTHINQLDNNGKTAMDYAVEYGHNKMIRKLYKNKGKVTSIENQKYAKKVITRPFKIVFWIGLALFSTIFVVVATNIIIEPMSILLIDFIIEEPIIFYPFLTLLSSFGMLIIGTSGSTHRSHKDLLLQP